VIATFTTLRDIFYNRMQTLKNFFIFKRKYKKKFRFFYLNFRLFKHLKYFKQEYIYNKFNNNNILKNRNSNINLIQKVIYKLSLFNLYLNSNLLINIIQIYLINKKIRYIFYGPI
jgi:hypothetical protein